MALAPLPAALLAAALSLPRGGQEPWRTTPLPGPLPAPVDEGRIPVPGASLHYAAYGAGAPLILLHGGAGSAEQWAFQLPALAARHRVILLDARGHGRSTRDDRPLGYHRMAEDLAAAMDALGLSSASILGWSDGGIVGLDLAIHHPTRVTALVAFGANSDLSGLKKGGAASATFAAYMARCAADYRRISPTPGGFDALLAALRPMWGREPAFTPEQLGRIRARTLVLDGEHDEIVSPEHARRLAERIPRARLLFLPDASHFAPWQRPEAFNAAVLEFLDGPGGDPPVSPTGE